MAVQETTSKLILDGNPEGLIGAMMRAETAVREQTGMIREHFETLGTAANKVIGIVGTIGAILAGGEMFEKVIEKSQEWTEETFRLARLLGSTNDEAGAYKVALHSLGIQQSVLEDSTIRLARTVAGTPQYFQQLGIQIKSNNGKLLPMNDILLNSVERLNSLKEGTDRNAAASLIFGRNWKDSLDILLLTKERLEESRKELHELGLEVGPERVKQMYEYRGEMAYVGMVGEAIKVQLGNTLLPVLIELGRWFHGVGPEGITLFTGALKGVVTFGAYAALGIMTIYEAAKATVSHVVTLATTVADVIEKVTHGDFSGAVAASKAGYSEMSHASDEFWDKTAEHAQKTNDFVKRLWGITAATVSDSSLQMAGHDHFNGKAPKDTHAAQMGTEQARLQAVLAGFKMREEAVQEGNKRLLADEDLHYQLGEIGEGQYNQKKYELQRKALQNTITLVDQETKAIEASWAKRLALAKTPEEKGKVKADEGREVSSKLAERQKLNSEISDLDQKFRNDTLIADKKLNDQERDLGAKWFAANAKSREDGIQKAKEFYGMVAAAANNALPSQLARIDKEEKAWVDSWAMQATSYEQFEKRKALIHAYYEKERLDITKKSQLEHAQTTLTYAQEGLGQMGNLLTSLNTLSKGKSKEFQIAQKGISMGMAISNTALGVTKALATYPPGVDFAMAALISAVGAAQLAVIASSDSGSGGSGVSNMGSYAGSPLSNQVVTQPVAQRAQAAPSLQLTLVNPIGTQKWFEDNLPGILKDFSTRNVPAGVVYA